MFDTMVERLGKVSISPSPASRTSASRIGVRDILKRSASCTSSIGLPGGRTRSRISSRKKVVDHLYARAALAFRNGLGCGIAVIVKSFCRQEEYFPSPIGSTDSGSEDGSRHGKPRTYTSSSGYTRRCRLIETCDTRSLGHLPPAHSRLVCRPEIQSQRHCSRKSAISRPLASEIHARSTG